MARLHAIRLGLPLMLCALAAPLARGESNSPLKLTVHVGPDPMQPGLYRYDFNLVLDNNTGTWLPGQGFGGLIFGDVQEDDSELADFVLDPMSVQVGPWSSLGLAEGFHNGPQFLPDVDPDTLDAVIWTPQFIGDELEWSGTSATKVDELLFSTIYTSNLADAADFQPAVLVPEPGGLTLVLVGFLAALVAGRRRASAAEFARIPRPSVRASAC